MLPCRGRRPAPTGKLDCAFCGSGPTAATRAFGVRMKAIETYSVGQIGHALYDVGGEYRRNM